MEKGMLESAGEAGLSHLVAPSSEQPFPPLSLGNNHLAVVFL